MDVKMKKLQYLLISYLLKEGKVELLLPDGFILEIGIVQENSKGDLVKSDNYCYVHASKATKSTLIDSYNLGLIFEEGDDTFLYEYEDGDGKIIRRFEVV